ncbi:uncharacterized protein LOC21392749 [Morus notabilis]|uniref:uncharacterized protein LOC21392749 n=1 Tax=Morus notabilis TaxID=981085 RepID=UPI000CED727B|nr:uncharacterized protein LOC21392749 [Morus notabilis]
MSFLSLEARYLSSCKKHKVLPNSAVQSWFSKVKIDRQQNEKFSVAVLLAQLKDDDISPLVDVLMDSGSSGIEAVDVLHESHCVLSDECLVALTRSIDSKLRVVDLHDISSRKELLRDLCRGGLACQVLNLRSNQIQKLNMAGRFMRLHTLNLDFCTSLTSLQHDCFSCMPSLLRLSMCETRITNLWTTSAALLKLPSLRELRFQNCLCCKDTGPCPSYRERTTLEIDLWELSIALPDLDARENLKYEIQEKDEFLMNATLRRYRSHHPSPICFEKYYREYVVASLPLLEVLDNLPVTKIDRVTAKTIYRKNFEYLPYKRQQKESIVSLLHKREMGSSKMYFQKKPRPKHLDPYHANLLYFSRSLCAAKLGSSEWPLLHPVSNFSRKFKEEGKRPRPRQFEYHPLDPSLMVFGTLGGEVVVINHENGNTVSYIPSVGAMSSVLGLCWLKKYPSKLIAGSCNGSLRLLDINQTLPKRSDSCCGPADFAFESFEQLTSLHVNSTDEKLLASGYSKDVALYDLGTGKRLQLFANIHREPINVAKFASHSPFIFATSSFDHDVKMWDLRQNPLQPCFTASSSRGNVTVCFSPDDLYLLVSAIDNEVKQLSAADGRLIMNLEIASTGSAHNYTRSHYMNGRDYIISGSWDEHVVRIFCAQSGKRLRDVYLEDLDSGDPMFVQSLRSDPFRDFNMSVLAASMRRSSKWEIIKVNLLASSAQYAEECSYGQFFSTSDSLGG